MFDNEKASSRLDKNFLIEIIMLILALILDTNSIFKFFENKMFVIVIMSLCLIFYIVKEIWKNIQFNK